MLCALPLAQTFMKSESGMELVICCLVIASLCFHSFTSFFHSLSNSFCSLVNSPLVLFVFDIGLTGSSLVPSIWSRIPWAYMAQMKQFLNITQLELDTSSLGIQRNLSPSLVVVDILLDLKVCNIHNQRYSWMLYFQVNYFDVFEDWAWGP